MAKQFFVVHRFAQCLFIDHIFLVAVKMLVMALLSVYLKQYEESTKMDVCQPQA